MPDRPNVLLLIDDEHRWDVAGFAGDDVVRTPTLDWLAETGTVFENAYTPAPVCVPARHSIRTGQLPRTWTRHGFDAFEAGYQTFARQAGEYGYMTASAGKMHYPGFAQMQGWRKRLGPTPMKRAIGDGVLDVHESPDECTYGGFGDWKWSAAEEITRAGVANSRVQVQDRRSVEGTEEFLKQYFSGPYYDRAQPDRPLVLQTSLIQPHYPFFVDDEDLFTYYLNRVEPYLEAPSDRDATVGVGRTVVPGEDVSERHVRRATAAYYAMVERIDGLFGHGCARVPVGEGSCPFRAGPENRAGPKSRQSINSSRNESRKSWSPMTSIAWVCSSIRMRLPLSTATSQKVSCQLPTSASA